MASRRLITIVTVEPEELSKVNLAIAIMVYFAHDLGNHSIDLLLGDFDASCQSEY